MADRVNLDMLSREPDLVATLVASDDVFSFLTREMSVPPSCAALAWGRAGQPRLVPAGRTIEATETRELLFVRTVPFVIDYRIEGLTTKDGFAVAASLAFAVQVVPEKAELLAFRTSMLGSSVRVRKDDLRQRCEASARHASVDFAKAREAAVLISPISHGEFERVLDERFQPLAFESGLVRTGETQIRFESPQYAEARRTEDAAAARRKQQESEEQLRAAAAQARAKHLEELGTLLDQVRSMAAGSGGNVADLIKTFDPTRRGALYEGLAALNRSTVQTEAILVVAGEEILALDPAGPRQPMHRRPLPRDAGPMRSIRVIQDADKRIVLVGARSGVHVINWPGESTQTHVFQADIQPRYGFNAAAIVGERIYATHSEIGLVCWPMRGSHDRSETVLASPMVDARVPPVERDTQRRPCVGSELCLTDVTRGAKAVRDLQVDSIGRLWFSTDHRVVGWTPGSNAAPLLLQTPAVIESLVVAEDCIYAGLADGAVLRWNTSDPSGGPEKVRGPGHSAVGSLAWASGGCVPRLLIADGRSQLDLHVLGDTYRGEYRCEQRLRWGFAADDYVVGVNDQRDQVLIWRIEEPGQPMASIHIGRLCGHSIQDVALLPNSRAQGGS
jgi:hypothetical protein